MLKVALAIVSLPGLISLIAWALEHYHLGPYSG